LSLAGLAALLETRIERTARLAIPERARFTALGRSLATPWFARRTGIGRTGAE
jgi:hypothetical protein